MQLLTLAFSNVSSGFFAISEKHRSSSERMFPPSEDSARTPSTRQVPAGLRSFRKKGSCKWVTAPSWRGLQDWKSSQKSSRILPHYSTLYTSQPSHSTTQYTSKFSGFFRFLRYRNEKTKRYLLLPTLYTLLVRHAVAHSRSARPKQAGSAGGEARERGRTGWSLSSFGRSISGSRYALAQKIREVRLFTVHAYVIGTLFNIHVGGPVISTHTTGIKVPGTEARAFSYLMNNSPAHPMRLSMPRILHSLPLLLKQVCVCMPVCGPLAVDAAASTSSVKRARTQQAPRIKRPPHFPRNCFLPNVFF